MLAQRHLRLLGQILAFCTAAAAVAAQEVYKLHKKFTNCLLLNIYAIWVALLTLDTCLLQQRYCAPFHPSHRTISLVC